jgi:hypothetical protein
MDARVDLVTSMWLFRTFGDTWRPLVGLGSYEYNTFQVAPRVYSLERRARVLYVANTRYHGTLD